VVNETHTNSYTGPRLIMVIELSGVQFGLKSNAYVITKSHDREAGVRFVITSLISVQNCTTRSSISTLNDKRINLHIVGFTSDLKEFWSSFVRLKLEIG
jgi:hypothetical protein